jgi:hypothetical protein
MVLAASLAENFRGLVLFGSWSFIGNRSLYCFSSLSGLRVKAEYSSRATPQSGGSLDLPSGFFLQALRGGTTGNQNWSSLSLKKMLNVVSEP